MGQTEGKQLPVQPASEAGTSSPPISPTAANTPDGLTNDADSTTKEGEEDKQHQQQHHQGNDNNNHVVVRKSNADMLKQGTEELKEGITKIGSNLLATAKVATSKVPYTSYSVSPGPAIKKAALAVEDAIVTVRAGITKTEEEPELLSLGRMSLFLPIIKSSVPIADLAKHNQAQRTTIEYLDPKIVVSMFKEYQRYSVITAKIVAQRQNDLANKIKDAEMSSSRKAVFTLAMNVTDMRHFNTQFSEVGRFHANLERTKQSIRDVLVMFEKLNAALPTEEQLEPLEIPAVITSQYSYSSYTSFSSLFIQSNLPPLQPSPSQGSLSTLRPLPSATLYSNALSTSTTTPTATPSVPTAQTSTPVIPESPAPQPLPSTTPASASDTPTPSETSTDTPSRESNSLDGNQ